MNHNILNARVYRISTVSKDETTTRYRAFNEQRTHLMGIILFSFSDYSNNDDLNGFHIARLLKVNTVQRFFASDAIYRMNAYTKSSITSLTLTQIYT